MVCEAILRNTELGIGYLQIATLDIPMFAAAMADWLQYCFQCFWGRI